MQKFLSILFVLFFLSSSAFAGEIYICVDSHGVKTIASEKQKGMKCELTETFADPTPDDIAKRDAAKKQKAITEQNKKAIDDCYENVKQQYNESRNAICQAKKLPPDCSLSPEDSQKLEDVLQEAKQRCEKLSVN